MDWIIMALEGRNVLGASSLWDIKIKTKELIKDGEQKKVNKNMEIVELLRNFDYNMGYNYEYPLKQLATVPSKISVTEVKRLFYREFIKDSAQIERSFEMTFDEPLFILDEQNSVGRELAARRGIVTHAVLERIDFNRHFNRDDICDLIFELEEKCVILDGEAKLINIKSIETFLSSTLANRIRRANFVKKETRFVTVLNDETLLKKMMTEPNCIEHNIMLHGVIDLIFEENGKIVIVDYKTDKLAEGSAVVKAQEHRLQMSLYAQAVEKYYNKRVKEKILYFFDKNVDVML